MNDDRDFAADAPVHPDEALLQRYFDGTLSSEEADAFERRMESEPRLADEVARYGAFFGALEASSFDAPLPDIATEAVASWAPPSARLLGLSGTVGVFAILDILLGGALVGLLVARGPVEVFKSWILGLKDILVAVHQLAPTPEQVAVVVPVALLVVTLLLVSTGYGLRRVLLRTESRS